MRRTRPLTSPFDGAKELPARPGWYPTLPKPMSDDLNELTPQFRSWWDGEYFSERVSITDTDAWVECAKRKRGIYTNAEIYWCGIVVDEGKQLRDTMKLADEYVQAYIEPNSYTPDLSRRRAREALKAKIKELIDAKA